MPALSIVACKYEFGSGLLAGAIRSWLRPVQALIAAPSILFIIALTAMLFCHPDFSFHRLSSFTFGLLVLGVVGRALFLKQNIFRCERASLAMIALTILVLIRLINQPVDEDTWSVLAAKYVFPFTLFHLAQLVFTDDREVRRFETFAFGSARVSELYRDRVSARCAFSGVSAVHSRSEPWNSCRTRTRSVLAGGRQWNVAQHAGFAGAARISPGQLTTHKNTARAQFGSNRNPGHDD